MSESRRVGLVKADRGGGPRSVGDVTHELFASGLPGAWNTNFRALMVVRSRWEDLVGQAMAKNVVVVALERDDRLIVEAATTAWVQEVKGLTRRILERISTYEDVPKIRDLVVRLHRHGRRDARHEPAATSPRRRTLAADERCRIDDVVRDIDDPTLREVVARVFERTLETVRTDAGKARRRTVHD